MFSSTISRILFFGGHYFSLLFVAHQMGGRSEGLLLAAAVVECCRVVFDYGLENALLARLHQEGTTAAYFSHGKLAVRVLATCAGQIVTFLVILCICVHKAINIDLPLVVSLQFTCLMVFGYLQAHLQTCGPGGMAALCRPLSIAALVQALLCALALNRLIPLAPVALTFHVMALIATRYTVQRADTITRQKAKRSGREERAAGVRSVLRSISPLGNVALIGLAYAKIDAFVVSLVVAGPLLTQYLLFQRVASAPLMLMSTLASVNIATISAQQADAAATFRRVARIRGAAVSLGLLSIVVILGTANSTGHFFSLPKVDLGLLWLQATLLGLQVFNGFHSAIAVGVGRAQCLWRITRNNSALAVLLLPLAAFFSNALYVASALCIVEMFCTVQHLYLYRQLSRAPREVLC